MAVSALVLRPIDVDFENVDKFYAAAPHEPTAAGLLPVDPVVAKFRPHFHGLLDAILAHKRPYLVVVSHGDPQHQVLDLKIDPLKNVIAGLQTIRLLSWLVDTIKSEGAAPDAYDVSRFVTNTGLPEATVLTIAHKCWKIRWADNMALQVHFRGCEIGFDTSYLEALRVLFRSKVVSAPKCPMLYTLVNPLDQRQGKPAGRPVADVVAWGKKTPVDGRRFIYDVSAHGPILLDLHYKGHKASSQSAVQSVPDIKKWAQTFHQNPATPSTTIFPIAALWPFSGDDYWLPNEDGYLKLIATVKKPGS